MVSIFFSPQCVKCETLWEMVSEWKKPKLQIVFVINGKPCSIDVRNQSGIIVRLYSCCLYAVNSLAPGRPRCHFKTAIFNLVLLIGIFTSSKDNALRWMPRDLTDDKSTLVQVMAWCHQVTSHYLSQCWPRSVSLYGVTRPQWVNLVLMPKCSLLYNHLCLICSFVTGSYEYDHCSFC